MKIILRTHGGLGNQIFQVLFARLYAGQCNASLCELHDANYRHEFIRSKALEVASDRAGFGEAFLSSMRIPKVLNRIGWNDDEFFSILDSVYLDGYFQSAKQYIRFEPSRIGNELRDIRDELRISTIKKRGHLTHLRLGDFFNSSEAARLHVIERLGKCKSGSTIITNQEALLNTPEIELILKNNDCELQTTEGYSPEEIIRLMSQFQNIDANQSTLTFWASVLGECNVEFNSPILEEANKFFKKCMLC